MAETAGQVLERYFGPGAYGETAGGNVTQQMISDLVRSGIPREDVGTLTSWQLLTQGRQGYMQQYPEMSKLVAPDMAYVRARSRKAELQAQIDDLRSMQRQLYGPEATYIIWFIQEIINQLTYEISYNKYQTGVGLAAQASVRANVAESEGRLEDAAKYREEASKLWASIGTRPEKKTTPVPIPDWLGEYLETSMPAKAA